MAGLVIVERAASFNTMVREFPHRRIIRLSQRHESRTKMTPAPGNNDCQFIFVALLAQD
jgi:hypothetical protein